MEEAEGMCEGEVHTVASKAGLELPVPELSDTEDGAKFREELLGMFLGVKLRNGPTQRKKANTGKMDL